MFDCEFDMRFPVKQWLASQSYSVMVEFVLIDIVAVQYGERRGRAIPPIRELIAVELKLHDVAGVIRQASSNLHLADKSYAAMPEQRIEAMRSDTIRKFIDAGIGLLSVGESVQVIIESRKGYGAIRDKSMRSRARTIWRRINFRKGVNDG